MRRHKSFFAALLLTIVILPDTAAGTPLTRYAAEVLAFSTEYSNQIWGTFQILGAPNTYPNYGDIPSAWASKTADGRREFIVLKFNNPQQANRITIYETFNPGAVDTIYVKNPNTGAWVKVWSGTAAPAGNSARAFSVSFPTTNFPVSQVRFAVNSPAVPGYNEYDAVALILENVILPKAECVWNNGDGTYTAKFGYNNFGSASVNVAIGANNTFTTTPIKRGQPATFKPKQIAAAFAVIFDGNPITWSVTYGGVTRTATASSSSPACGSNPIQPITPRFECLTSNGDGTFNAHFGYQNPNGFSVYVPIGSRNGFSPTPQNRNQPTVFQKGTKKGVLAVTWGGSTITWGLMGGSSQASSGSPLCQPVTPALTCVKNEGGGTYTARFGYSNPNDFTVKLKKGTPANKFMPAPAIRTGMTEKFVKGTVSNAFGVTWDGSALTWKVNGSNVVASSGSTSCGAGLAVMAESSDLDEEAEEIQEFLEYEEQPDSAENESSMLTETALEQIEPPREYALAQNYPNPFNPVTRIEFALPESAEVRLVVFDLLGREVRVLLASRLPEGRHGVVFDAADLPSGTYFYRLLTPQGAITQRMTLLR